MDWATFWAIFSHSQSGHPVDDKFIMHEKEAVLGFFCSLKNIHCRCSLEAALPPMSFFDAFLVWLL
jgi:hypothetical protein